MATCSIGTKSYIWPIVSRSPAHHARAWASSFLPTFGGVQQVALGSWNRNTRASEPSAAAALSCLSYDNQQQKQQRPLLSSPLLSSPLSLSLSFIPPAAKSEPWLLGWLLGCLVRHTSLHFSSPLAACQLSRWLPVIVGMNAARGHSAQCSLYPRQKIFIKNQNGV